VVENWCFLSEGSLFRLKEAQQLIVDVITMLISSHLCFGLRKDFHIINLLCAVLVS